MQAETRLRIKNLGLDNGAPPPVEDPRNDAARDPRPAFSVLYQLDITTGKARALKSEGNDGLYLYDQQALARVMSTAPYTIRQPDDPNLNARAVAASLDGDGFSVDMSMIEFSETKVFPPQRFRYRPEKSWQDLDRYLGSPLTFVTSIATHYKPRSFPVAFDADPRLLYFASNVGRDTFGLYALDLQTRQRTALAVEDPDYDVIQPEEALGSPALVFDRFQKLAGIRLPGPRARTRWLDADLARIQTAMAARFPRRDVTIVSWDDARKRVVAQVNTPGDPGRFYVYDDVTPATFRELVRRGAPFAGELNDTKPYAFDTPSGVHLTGMVALPAAPRLDPAPLIVICRDLPGPAPSGDFDPELQALADLGFAVATVYYRGSGGLGLRHRDAVRAGFDTIPAEDIRSAVAWLTTTYGLNPGRVALLGHDYGGYLALRTAQLHPGQFRAVVAINAPLTPADWAETTYAATVQPDYETKIREAFFDRALVKRISHPPFGDTIANPTLVVQDEQKRDLRTQGVKRFYEALKRRSIPAEYIAAPADLTAREPQAQAEVFSKIAGFLNDHVYDYNVDIGIIREVK